ITPAVRCVVLAQDMVVLDRQQGSEAALTAARRRRGTQYDPMLVDRFLGNAGALLEEARRDARWEAVLALQPGAPSELDEAQLDNACDVLADFADIKSSWTLQHSKRVAHLAEQAAERLGLAPSESAALRRAALLHDVGRVGISASIWG